MGNDDDVEAVMSLVQLLHRALQELASAKPHVRTAVLRGVVDALEGSAEQKFEDVIERWVHLYLDRT